MEHYLRTSRARYTAAQSLLFGPAFDAAWDATRRERGIVPGGADERATRDRLARIVVDLVTRGHMHTVGEIASAATIVLRDQGWGTA